MASFRNLPLRTGLRSDLLGCLVVLIFSISFSFSGISSLAFSSDLSQMSEQPKLRYSESDRSCAMPNGVLMGLFDLTYFNAVIPASSQVFAHYSFAVDTLDSEIVFKKVELKHWEEFGWMTRLAYDIDSEERRCALKGLRFFLEIKTPKGQVLFNRGSDSSSAFYYGDVERAQSCMPERPDGRKICQLELTVIDGLK